MQTSLNEQTNIDKNRVTAHSQTILWNIISKSEQNVI